MGWRIVLSIVIVVLYNVFETIWKPIYTQMQAVEAARVLNDHSITGNAFSQLYRSSDIVSTIATIMLVVVIVAIWWSYIRQALES